MPEPKSQVELVDEVRQQAYDCIEQCISKLREELPKEAKPKLDTWRNDVFLHSEVQDGSHPPKLVAGWLDKELAKLLVEYEVETDGENVPQYPVLLMWCTNSENVFEL